MNTLTAIFWSRADRRLRAGWRLLVHFLLVAGLIILSSLVAWFLPNLRYNRLLVVSTLAQGAAVILSVWLAGRFLDRRRWAEFGLHLSARWWRHLAFGLLLGALLMTGIFLFEWALGWLTVSETFSTIGTGDAFWRAIWWPLLLFLAVGFYEELFSRGYQLVNLAEGLSFAPLGKRGGLLLAYALTSAFFGALHAANPNATLISSLNIALAGLLLGLGMILTGELAIPIGLHITWNFFQGSVFGFPVSGNDFGTTFIAIRQGGPPLWTGGDFGPEAGLIGIVAMLIGALLTVWWVRHEEGRVELREEIAAYEPRVVRREPDAVAAVEVAAP